jgi:hypothetical protein
LPYTIGYSSLILYNTLLSWTSAKECPLLPLAWPNTYIIFVSKTYLPILNLWGLMPSCNKLCKFLSSLKGQTLREGFFNNLLIVRLMPSIDLVFFFKPMIVSASSSLNLVSLLDHVDFTNFDSFFMVLLFVPTTQHNNQNYVYYT